MIPESEMQKLRSLSRAARGGTLDSQRLAERCYEMGREACHAAVQPPETLNLLELEKQALKSAINATHGNLQEVAKLLGVGKTTVYRKIRQYGLSTRPRFEECPSCGHRLTRKLNVEQAA